MMIRGAMAIAGFARTAVQASRHRRRRSGWKAVRWPILAYVPAIVALAGIRRRIGLPRPITIPLASAAPLAVVAALPQSKWRSAAVWATYLWLFKVAHQVPFDEPDKLSDRVRVRHSVRLDSVIGAGQIWFHRAFVWLASLVVFVLMRRICRELQRSDQIRERREQLTAKECRPRMAVRRRTASASRYPGRVSVSS